MNKRQKKKLYKKLHGHNPPKVYIKIPRWEFLLPTPKEIADLLEAMETAQKVKTGTYEGRSRNAGRIGTLKKSEDCTEKILPISFPEQTDFPTLPKHLFCEENSNMSILGEKLLNWSAKIEKGLADFAAKTAGAFAAYPLLKNQIDRAREEDERWTREQIIQATPKDFELSVVVTARILTAQRLEGKRNKNHTRNRRNTT